MADSRMPATSFYSDVQIKQAVEAGHIICRPFEVDHVNPASLDITLGQNYYRTEQRRVAGFYNPFDPQAVGRYFVGPHQAQKHSDWATANQRQLFVNIPPDWPIIVLAPQERILAHSHEFVGIKPPGGSMVKARSTWGRNGVSVCFDAGWGDPGFINRWTLEIYNLNHRHSVVLPVFERIAQLVFFATGQVEAAYGPDRNSKYQSYSHDQLNQLVKNWTPDLMLPRSYRDSRRRPSQEKLLNRPD